MLHVAEHLLGHVHQHVAHIGGVEVLQETHHPTQLRFITISLENTILILHHGLHVHIIDVVVYDTLQDLLVNLLELLEEALPQNIQ